MQTNSQNLSAIRGVVFDFDGTLVDSNAIKRRAYFEASAALGNVEPIVTAVLNSCVGDRRQILTEIARRAQVTGEMSSRRVDDLVAHYTRYCEEQIAVCPEVAGATDTLSRLAARGFGLFVNSATPTQPLVRLIERRGWTRHFRGILGSPESKIGNLQTAASVAQLAPAEMLMVGDGEDDRQAARAFGCAFVGVFLHERRFEGEADVVLSDLSALPEFVSRWKPESACR